MVFPDPGQRSHVIVNPTPSLSGAGFESDGGARARNALALRLARMGVDTQSERMRNGTRRSAASKARQFPRSQPAARAAPTAHVSKLPAVLASPGSGIVPAWHAAHSAWNHLAPQELAMLRHLTLLAFCAGVWRVPDARTSAGSRRIQARPSLRPTAGARTDGPL